MRQFIVIILHYGNIDDTLRCLDSILPQCNGSIMPLLVDNGSASDIIARVKAQFGAVPTLQLSTNNGWAGGNNAGIAQARALGADLVCLLNNDTILPPNTLARLADVARAQSPCLLHPAIDFLDPAEGIQLDPSTGPGAAPLPGHVNLYELDFAYGACLTIPIAVFDRIGMFDERFFLQLEETDFFQRARRAGIPSLCTTSVRILHAESRSFGGRDTPEKLYYTIRNSLLLAEKNRATPAISRHILRRMLWSIGDRITPEGGSVKLAFIPWLASPHDDAKAFRAACRDYALRRFGRRRTI